MRRKWLLVAGLLLLALGALIAVFFGLTRQAPRQSAESIPAAPTEAPESRSDRVDREDPGIGTTQLPRGRAAEDRP